MIPRGQHRGKKAIWLEWEKVRGVNEGRRTTAGDGTVDEGCERCILTGHGGEREERYPSHRSAGQETGCRGGGFLEWGWNKHPEYTM